MNAEIQLADPEEASLLVSPHLDQYARQKKMFRTVMGLAALIVLVTAMLMTAINNNHEIKIKTKSEAQKAFKQVLSMNKTFIGDVSKDGFAKKDENLIFYDDFDSLDSLSSGVYNVQRTMDGGGNAQFQYYTDSPKNLYINSTDNSLRFKPGLFQDLPPINGVPALDVMLGNCTPYPACATFQVPNCTTSFGCEEVGSPLDVLKPTTSARIDTKDTFAFQYGRMELKLRFPRGDWLWSGIWMMPTESRYGGWPSDGELDLLETRGNPIGYEVRGNNAGRDVILSTLHIMANVFWKSQGFASGIDWTEDFHVFGLFWSEKEMYSYYLDDEGNEVKMIDLSAENGGYKNGFGVPPYGYDPATDDGNPELSAPDIGVYNGQPLSAPFNQPFYLIMNLAVGGYQAGCPDPDYWGSDAIWCTICEPVCGQPTNEFWKAKDYWYPTWLENEKDDRLSLAIDWIKVWQ